MKTPTCTDCKHFRRGHYMESLCNSNPTVNWRGNVLADASVKNADNDCAEFRKWPFIKRILMIKEI